MPAFAAFFGVPIRVTIPDALTDETALLTFLDISDRELRKIWFYRHRMYHHFSIAKSSNKARAISAPDERLKFIQRKLADKLGEMYRPRKSVHGFVADRSVKTNALSHLHRKFVLNVDLTDFFPTITENRVQGLLTALGLNSRVAEIIARVCCNNGHLPQGAPSSPVISNMICFRLDKQLMAIAKGARCIYTRYADDITFSSHQPPAELFEAALPPSGRISPSLLAPALRGAIESNGFVINQNKAHYADRNSRRTVTGLRVNELVNVDRRYVRNIRAALYSVEMLGAKEAQQKFHDAHGGRASLAAHLQGKIAFLTHIKGRWDPVVRGITLRFNNCFPERALKVRPTLQEVRERSVWVIDKTWTDKQGEVCFHQGSAFFLKDVGLVTAAHCVDGASEIEVYHPTKPANKFVVGVSRTCDHRDIALLEHSISNTEYLELVRSPRAIAQGDLLTAVGYPRFHVGDRLNARPGTVISLTTRSAVQMIEVSQTLTQGMSGGPLLDGDDGVVGITHKGGPGEGRDFAISIKMLNQWLEEK